MNINDKKDKKIALIGATGNVGRKIIELLIERKSVDPSTLKMFASKQSVGKHVSYQRYKYVVSDLSKYDFNDCEIALFATDSEVSRQYIPTALKAGATVVDSSSCYRLDPNVPLIVPPVNSDLISEHTSLYAIANCLACPISIVLKPLHDLATAKRVVASTYQSASGAGKGPMDELYAHTKSFYQNEKLKSQFFPRLLAFNVIPQVDKIMEDGFTYEEFKIINEINKVVSGDIKMLATSVRVPVMIGHAISLAIEFQQAFELAEIKRVLLNSPGITFCEDYLTPIEVVGKDDVYVGRLRRDPTVPNGVVLWLVSDNLRRGAALDVVEVVEKLKLRA